MSGKTYGNRIQASLTAAEKDPALTQTTAGGNGFGTPAIVANGKPVAWQNPGWLDTVVKTAYPAA